MSVLDPSLWPGLRELVAARYRGERWPSDYAAADVAWHRYMTERGEPMPGRPALMARWSWTDHAVKVLLAASRPPADRQPATNERREGAGNRQPVASLTCAPAKGSMRERSSNRSGEPPLPPRPPRYLGGRLVPEDLPALMPSLPPHRCMALAAAGVETPEFLLDMTYRELAHSRGVGHAVAKLVVQALGEGGWSLKAEPPPPVRAGVRSRMDETAEGLALFMREPEPNHTEE